MSTLMTLDASGLMLFSIGLGALGLALLALLLVRVWWRHRRSAQTIRDALMSRFAETTAAAPVPGQAPPAQALRPEPGPGADRREGVDRRGGHDRRASGDRRTDGTAPGPRLRDRVETRLHDGWVDTRFGKSLVSTDELKYLEQCGFHGKNARATYASVKLAVPIIFALVVAAWQLPASPQRVLLAGFIGFAVSYLSVTVLLRRRAGRRCEQAEEELPILVDMLRLLQGVGMSIDQSLQVIVVEFGNLLPVLGPELKRANDQVASGRPRDQTLRRLGLMYGSEDINALVLLLAQVDRIGGAVQEPLRTFGLRLQEGRRMKMKEKVGRLTVKMTGVMVITMLPVLLIVTAGPGFLGVIRTMAHVSGGAR